MRAIGSIAARELASFFRTPVGWVVMALYLLLSGFYVAFGTITPGEVASLRGFFGMSQWVLLIVAPAISMKLIADEARTGTLESLTTAPVSDWQIVGGKYLGALGFFACMLAPTLVFVGVLELLSDPDYGPIGAGYLALILVGMVYLSVGLLCSTLTESQIVALLATLFFFILIEVASLQGGRSLGPPFDEPLFALSIRLRMADMAKGVIDTSHIIFFIAVSAWFCVLSVIALEVRRWK